MKRVIWAICFVILCLPLTAQAFSKIPSRSTVAVIDVGFKGESVSTDPQSRMEMAKVVTEYIAYHLEKGTKLEVVQPEILGYSMDEQTLALTGGFTQDRAMDIGKALHVDYILCGSILGFGVDRTSTSTIGFHVNKNKATTKVSLKLIDVRTGSIVATAIGDGESGASVGGTTLPMLLTAFTSVHAPVSAYEWDNASVNGEIVDNSLTKAANIAVSRLLEKTGISVSKEEGI